MWKLLLLLARMRIGNFTQSEFKFELESRTQFDQRVRLLSDTNCCLWQRSGWGCGCGCDVDVAEDLVVGWGSLWHHRLALPLGLPSGSGRQRFAPVTSFSAICSIFHSAVFVFFFFIFHLSFPLLLHQAISRKVIWSRADCQGSAEDFPQLRCSNGCFNHLAKFEVRHPAVYLII